MWQADPKYWGRTSPVLFPFVGGSKNKEYTYGGKTYRMGQHGFARDMEFCCEYVDGAPAEAEACDTQAGNSIWFALSSGSSRPTENYPFCFCLHIGYELVENEVKVRWRVENTDETSMYFSIGAHPAFLCPIHGRDGQDLDTGCSLAACRMSCTIMANFQGRAGADGGPGSYAFRWQL